MGEQTSILITTHYRNDTLGRAIESALAQTYAPVEVVVVDDSGEGHARPVADRYDAVTYVAHEANRGQMRAWKTGIERSTGRYVQFLDDDDRLRERKIELQIEHLAAADDAGVVCCGYQWDDGRVSMPDPAEWGDDQHRAALAGELVPCQTSTMLLERSVIKRISPFPEFPARTDTALKIELTRETRIAAVERVLVDRWRGTRSQSDSLTAARAWFDIIEHYGDLYEPYPGLERETLGKAYTYLGMQHAKQGDRYRAARNCLKGFVQDRRSHPLKVLALSLFGRSGVRAGQWIATRRSTND